MKSPNITIKTIKVYCNLADGWWDGLTLDRMGV